MNVDYEVYTAMNSQVVANMTFISKDMASGKSKVTYEGQKVTVSSVSLVDTSGNSRKITFNIFDINCQEKKKQKIVMWITLWLLFTKKDCAVHFW